MYTLVIIRHGQSQWNKKNLFCGWTDVDLTEKGFEDARAAGRLLKKEGYTFDICYTSVLKRAIHTAYAVLDEMDSGYQGLSPESTSLWGTAGKEQDGNG